MSPTAPSALRSGCLVACIAIRASAWAAIACVEVAAARGWEQVLEA